MLKNKKLTILIAVFAILLILSNTCFAATVSSEKAKFEVVENNVCNIKINNSSEFEKKMVSYDLEKKEVDIQLKVTNNGSTPLDDPCEIVLVIDNSDSMKNSVSSTQTRMQAVTSSAKKLVNELFKHDTVSVSVVSFSTANGLNSTALSEDWIPEGTLQDAKLLTALTDSKDTVLNAITTIENGSRGARTDIEAGLTIAGNQFSNTINNKFIILLSDGVPNISLGVGTGNYEAIDITNTKNALLNLASKGIKIFSMLTGVPNTFVNDELGTYKDIAEAIFGYMKS